eukprot:TRINITY_DN4024_c0_g1_i1.p3 TRINITY_DN4024_c0_g1~~TRINITY_DN4024_c0_g1_i1.p3  ORF type:complete len:241 (+),score=14.63 TRINITY_DN4024_c0_g1_i1:4650-5372(+)
MSAKVFANPSQDLESSSCPQNLVKCYEMAADFPNIPQQKLQESLRAMLRKISVEELLELDLRAVCEKLALLNTVKSHTVSAFDTRAADNLEEDLPFSQLENAIENISKEAQIQSGATKENKQVSSAACKRRKVETSKNNLSASRWKYKVVQDKDQTLLVPVRYSARIHEKFPQKWHEDVEEVRAAVVNRNVKVKQNENITKNLPICPEFIQICQDLNSLVQQQKQELTCFLFSLESLLLF